MGQIDYTEFVVPTAKSDKDIEEEGGGKSEKVKRHLRVENTDVISM